MDNEMSEALLQHQMQETRASLTEKIEILEQKVVGTVENATTAVNATVDAIKETVHETVATVQEGVRDSVATVKDVFDLPGHVQEHPWLMVGGSVAVGYCLGTLLVPGSSTQSASTLPSQPARNPEPAPLLRAPAMLSPAPAAAPSIWAPEVAKLKGLALGVLFGTARELILSSMPAHMGDQLKEVVDSVTRKVGGEPLPSSDWAKLCEPTSPATGQAAAPQPPNKDSGNGHSAARRW